MTFHSADPMIMLYNPVEKLEKMAEAAGIPYIPNQILDIGLTILRNTRNFKQALGNWELQLLALKTWANFKPHFTQAQKQLKAVQCPSMQQAGYHHTNMLANQLCSDLETHNSEIMSII